jgi:hypothetical protein
MKHLMKARPSPAMVVALIALFVALSGTAAALSGSNTVFSDDVVNNQVRSADVRDDTLASGGLQAVDLRSSSVGSSEVQDDSLTGTDITNLSFADLQPDTLTGGQINESTLGEVPAARQAKLGGLGRWTGGGSCDPEGPTSANYLDCAIVSLNLPAPSRVFLVGEASGFRERDADSMSGYCQLTSNDGFILPNSRVQIQSTDYTENIGLTAVTGIQSAGNHDYAVACSQGAPGAIFYLQVGISAVGLSPD